MRVVVNAVPVAGTSLGVVAENLFKGWAELDTDDELHVVLRPGVGLDVPEGISVHEVGGSRFSAMERAVPALCRRVGADAMLGVTPATTLGPLPCPRAVIALDLRHEVRPEQFSARTRLLRKVSYGLGYRRADAIACISQRTRDDLVAAHPSVRRRPVTVAQLGADHVLAWATSGPARAPTPSPSGNGATRTSGWSSRPGRSCTERIPLVVVGLPAAARAAVEADVARRGLADLVTVLPWLSAEDFQRRFTGASLVVFPSDYEGFGLPAVEAMRLGIPVVVTPDRALLEVTGGLATTMDGWDAAALARAVGCARRTTARSWRRVSRTRRGSRGGGRPRQVRATLAACTG